MPDPTASLPVPQSVIDTLLARITARSAFIGAGAAGVEILSAPAGGNFVQRNKQAEDTTRAEVIDGNASTPAILGVHDEIAPVLRRKRVRKAFDGVNAALGLLSQDPSAAVIEQSAAYWATEIDHAIISVLSGVFDASAGICRVTHRRSVATTSPTAPVPISYSQIVRAGGMLGDNVLDLASVAVHGTQWSDLLLEVGSKANFIPLDGSVMVPYINGLRVTVSDTVPVDDSDTNVAYTAFLSRPGAIWVQIQQDIKEFMAQRPEDPSTVVSESLHFGVGVAGVKWNVATINPANSDLATATNYAKTTSNVKDVGIVALVTNATA